MSKLGFFLHLVILYTKFTLATHKFEKKALSGLKNEFPCMDLENLGKPAKEKNVVKFLLVRFELFHGTVHAKGIKTKGSKETAQPFQV